MMLISIHRDKKELALSYLNAFKLKKAKSIFTSLLFQKKKTPSRAGSTSIQVLR